jgi:hypothetical protein
MTIDIDMLIPAEFLERVIRLPQSPVTTSGAKTSVLMVQLKYAEFQKLTLPRGICSR